MLMPQIIPLLALTPVCMWYEESAHQELAQVLNMTLIKNIMIFCSLHHLSFLIINLQINFTSYYQ